MACQDWNYYSSYEYVTQDLSWGQPYYDEANYPGTHAGWQQESDQSYNTYEMGWNNYPNYSEKGHENYNASTPVMQSTPIKEKKYNLEELFSQLRASEASLNKSLEQFQIATNQIVLNYSNNAAIHNLEVQVGQLTTMLSEKEEGNFLNTSKDDYKLTKNADEISVPLQNLESIEPTAKVELLSEDHQPYCHEEIVEVIPTIHMNALMCALSPSEESQDFIGCSKYWEVPKNIIEKLQWEPFIMLVKACDLTKSLVEESYDHQLNKHPLQLRLPYIRKKGSALIIVFDTYD